jgi:hypothetical protein
MRDITLNKLYKQLFPDGGKHKGEFARLLGQKQTTICKLAKGEGCTLKSRVWKEVKETVKNKYGYILISESKIDNEKVKLEEENQILRMQNQIQEKIIAEHLKTIQDLVSSVRIVVGVKEALMNGELILNQHRRETK